MGEGPGDLALWVTAHNIGEGVKDLSALGADEREGKALALRERGNCPVFIILGKGVLGQGTIAFIHKGAHADQKQAYWDRWGRRARPVSSSARDHVPFRGVPVPLWVYLIW